MSVQYDEEYYDILTIIDRLREECVDRYGNLFRASKAYGDRNLNRYLNTNAYSLGLKNLKKICKFLNISYQYAVFGGNKGVFDDSPITLNNFYRIYKRVYEGEVDKYVYHGYWRLKNKRSSTFPLKFLIKLAKRSNKTIDFFSWMWYT